MPWTRPATAGLDFPAGASPAPNDVPKKRSRQRYGVVERRRDLARQSVGVPRDAQLSQRRVQVEEDPLAHHPLALEREHDEQRELASPSRPRKPSPRPLVR